MSIQHENTTAKKTEMITIVVVRPIKVIATLMAATAALFMTLSVAATTWMEAENAREGLWERCHYLVNRTAFANDCARIEDIPGWLYACRSLCMMALVMTMAGIIVTTLGLRSLKVYLKHHLYFAGMVLFLIADGMQVTSLITFPVKFLEEISKQQELHWNSGWAYGIGWGAAILNFTAAILLLLDKGKLEVIHNDVRT